MVPGGTGMAVRGRAEQVQALAVVRVNSVRSSGRGGSSGNAGATVVCGASRQQCSGPL